MDAPISADWLRDHYDCEVTPLAAEETRLTTAPMDRPALLGPLTLLLGWDYPLRELRRLDPPP